MLNAGNELRAELAGCRRLARMPDLGRPYLGTVLAIVGPQQQEPANRLAEALQLTAAAVVGSELDEPAMTEASAALDLPPEAARRYVDQLKDPEQGLVADGLVDPQALRTVVDLRRRYLPWFRAGPDQLATALEPNSGLLAPR